MVLSFSSVYMGLVGHSCSYIFPPHVFLSQALLPRRALSVANCGSFGLEDQVQSCSCENHVLVDCFEDSGAKSTIRNLTPILHPEVKIP